MPRNLTITEALAELKTIEKRLEKKRSAVLQNLGRNSRLTDPMASEEGGSIGWVKRERQAIKDLQSEIVAIRSAILKSNVESKTTMGDTTKTVFEWLTWRREVAPNERTFLASINQTIRANREKVQQKGGRVVSAGVTAVVQASGDAPPEEILLHLNEAELLAEQENLEKVLGDLDGRLSLLNATTVINIGGKENAGE